MAGIALADIEAALDWWRRRRPSADALAASDEVRALAEVLATMAYRREAEREEARMPPAAAAAWLAWHESLPDTPCIAICSTSQGDAVCKGCGRTADEVRQWPALSPAHKRAVWRRIRDDGTAWRFNRYAERARGGPP